MSPANKRTLSKENTAAASNTISVNFESPSTAGLLIIYFHPNMPQINVQVYVAGDFIGISRLGLSTRQRPFGVTLLAGLHVIQAFILLVAGLAVMALGAIMPRLMFHIPRFLEGLLSVIGIILIVVAVLDIVFAYGLWTGKGWAWILALIFAVLGIIGSVFSVARGGLGAIVTLILDIVIVVYLMQPRVKAYFGEAKP